MSSNPWPIHSACDCDRQQSSPRASCAMRPTGLLVPGATYEYECSNVSCLFLGRRHPLLVLAPLSCEHRAVSLSICLLAQASQRMASPLQPAGLVLKRPRLVGGERPASRAIHPAHRRFVAPARPVNQLLARPSSAVALFVWRPPVPCIRWRQFAGSSTAWRLDRSLRR